MAAYSDACHLVALGRGPDRSSRHIPLRDATTLEEKGRLTSHQHDVRVLAFSPDGETLASGDERGLVKLLDVATREELLTLEGKPGAVGFVGFSPDGSTLAVASDLSHPTEEARTRTSGRD